MSDCTTQVNKGAPVTSTALANKDGIFSMGARSHGGEIDSLSEGHQIARKPQVAFTRILKRLLTVTYPQSPSRKSIPSMYHSDSMKQSMHHSGASDKTEEPPSEPSSSTSTLTLDLRPRVGFTSDAEDLRG